MIQVGMHEAKTNLSRLVLQAQAGEEVVIARNGKPVVRLLALEEPSGMAKIFGSMKGQIHMSDDFDELPDDIAEAFGMK